jgi:hypothetical protein
MNDDIVTRLRDYMPTPPYHKLPKSVADMQEAADEIERLRKLVGQSVTTIVFDEDYL